MKVAHWLVAFSLTAVMGGLSPAQPPAVSARIETVPLRLMAPDPYQVTVVIEPIRRLRVVAPADGLIRSVAAHPGGTVRASEDVVELDPTEAVARLRMAQADVKEKQALGKLDAQKGAVYQAQLEAAEARVELARVELDRCRIRAPFAGRVLDVAVTPGQFVLKGTTLVEIADTSSLRAIVPVDRRTVSAGAAISVSVEEQEVSGKVSAVLPLPESFAVLRELATPFAAALVVFPNPRGQLDAGFRARPAGVPSTAIANIPRRGVRADDLRGAAASMVQVIRNEYVTNIPVQVLGGVGPDRVQVSGQFRDTDALIVGSSVALAPGTLVRFSEAGGGRGIEGTSPDPTHGGLDGWIVAPGSGAPAASGRGASPAGGRNRYPAAGPRRAATGGTRPANPPAQTTGATPF